MRHPMFGDFDFLFGEDEPDPDGRVYVSFQDERVSEEQTETDVKNMEGRLKMSLQQLKEQVLGKVRTERMLCNMDSCFLRQLLIFVF